MSASLTVDLAATCDYRASLMIGSGSNLIVGEIVDLIHADTYCNVWTAGGAAGGSGVIEIRVQTSDTTTSGDFTDPTSGLAQLPGWFASGGVVFVNSGLHSSGSSLLSAPVNNAPLFCSGGIQFAAFQKPHRYARLINNSGSYPGAITAGFVSQKRTVGSGGGFSYQPGSGTVNV